MINPYASSKKYQYSIAWSAKGGCTLFRRLFLFLHQNELLKEPTNQWHELARDFPFTPKFQKAILLCRNPYDRAVSAFINKLCGGRGHNYLSKIIKLDQVSFKNFLLYLLEHKSKLHKIDPHITPQVNTLNCLEDHKIFKIKLENFDKEIIDAYNHFDLQELIPDIKTFLSKPNQFRNKTQRNDDNFFCGETVYSIDDTVFPDSNNFYNDELRELTYKIYEKDFIPFGYSK
jgi:hypothetical protein